MLRPVVAWPSSPLEVASGDEWWAQPQPSQAPVVAVQNVAAHLSKTMEQQLVGMERKLSNCPTSPNPRQVHDALYFRKSSRLELIVTCHVCCPSSFEPCNECTCPIVSVYMLHACSHSSLSVPPLLSPFVGAPGTYSQSQAMHVTMTLEP